MASKITESDFSTSFCVVFFLVFCVPHGSESNFSVYVSVVHCLILCYFYPWPCIVFLWRLI